MRHPLVDSVHTGWVRSESRAPVVYLSEGRADLFVQAGAQGLAVVLVTDALSSLSEPYCQAMSDSGGAWVVRAGDGTLRDGLSGARLEQISDAVGRTAVSATDGVADAFLRPKPAEHLELVISVSMRHKALATTRLGGPLELLSQRLRGEQPSSWGVHEPAGTAWDRDQLTTFARSRMPDDTRFVATGRRDSPMIATIAVSRTGQGLEETTRAFIGMGLPGADRARTAVETVTAALAALDETGMPLIAVALARPSQVSQLRPPLLQLPPSPLALLIGPPGVKALGLDPARLAGEFGAVVVGRPRIPGLLFPLGTLDVNGWDQLDRLLASFDQGRLNTALGTNRDALRGLDTRPGTRSDIRPDTRGGDRGQ